MKVAVFSSKSYDRLFLEKNNQQHNHELKFFSTRLNSQTVALARGFEAVCVLVNDRLDRSIYVSLEDLFARSNIISLHCPLTPETHHLIDDRAIAMMKSGVMLVNTRRQYVF